MTSESKGTNIIHTLHSQTTFDVILQLLEVDE